MPLFTSEYVFSDDYPTIEPSLKLDFANSRALDPRITFTRASTGTYVGRDGLIKTAGEDEARFDHDPTTGESLGLLIEETRTNYAKKSESLSNTIYWTPNYNVNATTAPSITAPDGSTNTWKLVVANNTSQQRFALNGNQGTFAANTYTWSVFAKAAEYSYLGISLYDGNYYRATFDLSNGTASNVFDATAKITPYPNGWYRCSITATTVANLRNSVNYVDAFWPYATAQTAGASQTGDGTSGVYVWGPQLETAGFAGPTSYISTGDGTSSVTRAEEQAYMTGESFSSWYNPTEGSVVTAFNPTLYVGPNDGGRVFRIDHQTISDNRIDYVVTANGNYQPYVSINGVSPSGFGGGPNGTPFVVGTDYKISMGFAANDYVVYKNGTQTLSSTTPASVPIADRLSLGLILNGHRKSFYYYPKRLTNTQLQTLTQ